jgi:hypothetical protein
VVRRRRSHGTVVLRDHDDLPRRRPQWGGRARWRLERLLRRKGVRDAMKGVDGTRP